MRRAAFTLIELLLVISITALLIGILLPALTRARDSSKFSGCASHLRQVAVAIQQYAMDNQSAVPIGPATPLPYFPARRWCDWATNQLWVGAAGFDTGLGKLVPAYLSDPRVFFCPGSDQPEDTTEEIPHIVDRGPADAFASYMYRQLDETSRSSFDDLGTNSLGFRANALLFDVNSLGMPTRSHHNGAKVNIAYRDSHVATADNSTAALTIRAADFAAFPVSVDRRLSEIVCAADFAENGNPVEMPPLP